MKRKPDQVLKVEVVRDINNMSVLIRDFVKHTKPDFVAFDEARIKMFKTTEENNELLSKLKEDINNHFDLNSMRFSSNAMQLSIDKVLQNENELVKRVSKKSLSNELSNFYQEAKTIFKSLQNLQKAELTHCRTSSTAQRALSKTRNILDKRNSMMSFSKEKRDLSRSVSKSRNVQLKRTKSHLQRLQKRNVGEASREKRH